jgi:hypothetical protein
MIECTNEHVKIEKPGIKRPVKEDDGGQNPSFNNDGGLKRVKLENQLDMTFGPNDRI